MKRINLHRDELATILSIVDQLNPAVGDDILAGRLTISEDNSSGIGSTITLRTAVTINGISGFFEKDIVNESDW